MEGYSFLVCPINSKNTFGPYLKSGFLMESWCTTVSVKVRHPPPRFLFHLEAFELVKAKEICNASALLMSIMDFSEYICQVRFTGSTSHRADQIKASCTSCRSNRIYLEEKVGGGGILNEAINNIHRNFQNMYCNALVCEHNLFRQQTARIARHRSFTTLKCVRNVGSSCGTLKPRYSQSRALLYL